MLKQKAPMSIYFCFWPHFTYPSHKTNFIKIQLQTQQVNIIAMHYISIRFNIIYWNDKNDVLFDAHIPYNSHNINVKRRKPNVNDISRHPNIFTLHITSFYTRNRFFLSPFGSSTKFHPRCSIQFNSFSCVFFFVWQARAAPGKQK